MKKHFTSIVILALLHNFVYAQILAPAITTFKGDLTNQFTVNDPNGPNMGGGLTVTNGIQFNNLIGGHEARAYANIYQLNNNSFKASCDVSLSSGYKSGHLAMAFTSGTLDVISSPSGTYCFDDITTSSCTYTNTNQSAIEVVMMTEDIDIAQSGILIYVYTKLPNVTHVSVSTPIFIPSNAINNFSIEFTRTSLTTGMISCTDKTTKTLIGSSNVVIDKKIVGLNTFQSGVVTPAYRGRILTGNINNIVIENCFDLPIPNVSNDQSICSGQSATLSASTVKTNPIYSWVNESNPSAILSTSNDLQTNALNSSMVYSVSYTSDEGVGRSCPSPKAFVTVNVGVLDSVSEIVSTENEFCIGSNPILTCATPNGVWSSLNSAIATVSNSGIVTGVSAGNVEMIYTVTSGNNCTSSSLLNMVVNDKIAHFSIEGLSNNCPGSNVEYTVNPITPNTNYYWTLNNGANVSFNDYFSTKVKVIFPDSPGSVYNLKAIAVNACGNIEKAAYQISVKSDVPNRPNIVCTDIVDCKTLALETAPNSGVSVSWNNGGSLESDVNFIARDLDHQVSVTFSKNGCSYSDSYFEGNCSDGLMMSVNNSVETKNSTIYPNPNDGNFTFETSGKNGKAYIYNSVGVIVSEIELENFKTIYQVNFTNLVKGTYILKIVDGSTSGGNMVFVVQ
jgi:hypothetical protein